MHGEVTITVDVLEKALRSAFIDVSDEDSKTFALAIFRMCVAIKSPETKPTGMDGYIDYYYKSEHEGDCE